MRRKDLEVLEKEKLVEILDGCKVCRLGIAAEVPYIVPMNFGYDWSDRLTLYFHSAPKGRKIELIEKAGRATFEAEAGCAVKAGAKACEVSCYYQSVIGHGRISVLRDDPEKQRALRCVMEHYTGKQDWDILDKMLPVVVGIRLEIEEMTAKAHQPHAE